MEGYTCRPMLLSLRQLIFPALILACAKLKYFCTVCITTPKIHSHSTAWSMNFPKFIVLIIFSCCLIHPLSTSISCSVKPQASRHHIYNSYNSGLHHECNFLKKVNSWPWIDVWDLTWLLIIGLLVPTTTVCSPESGQWSFGMAQEPWSICLRCSRITNPEGLDTIP